MDQKETKRESLKESLLSMSSLSSGFASNNLLYVVSNFIAIASLFDFSVSVFAAASNTPGCKVDAKDKVLCLCNVSGCFLTSFFPSI